MSKYKEALKEVCKKCLNSTGCIDCAFRNFDNDYCDEIKPLVKLVEKEKSMKPIYEGKFPMCRNCGKLLHSIMQNRCDECGQVIDWSE